MNITQGFFIICITSVSVILSKNIKDINSFPQSFPFVGIGIVSLLLLLYCYLYFYNFDTNRVIDELLLTNQNSWIAKKIIFVAYILIFVGVFMQITVLIKNSKQRE